MHRTLWALAGLGLTLGIVAALWLINRHRPQPEVQRSSPALVSQTALQALPHKSASSADFSHLAAQVLPPTNSWLSGLVLQAEPKAVYPMPLSFRATDGGFEVGLPHVSSTATEIDGQHVPGMMAKISGATGFQLGRYDKVSATLSYRSGSQTQGTVTLSEGSPFVFYHATTASTLTLQQVNPADIVVQNTHYIRFRVAGQLYVISAARGTLSEAAGVIRLRLPTGQDAAFYALPGDTDELQPYAANAVRSVSVENRSSGNQEQTTLHYHTVNGQPTAVAFLPYTHLPSDGVIAHYASIYGAMPVKAGISFVTSVPAVPPQAELQLGALTTAQRKQLAALLTADSKHTAITPSDSYFAGKQLARAANLLSVAEQLHQTAQATTLKARLQQAFATRLTQQYWYYDTGLHGVAAATAGFGSEDFNDHHFHYGYWLYAAAILAKYDDHFKQTYQKQLNLLAADIASYQAGSQFPVTRTYDPYAGHSWAAGLAPFADGNNQESSSEAVHAWNGVALWGAATGNRSLEQTGRWLLANEVHAAATIWRVPDTADPALQNYSSPVVDITFGGKRVYSTFFSDQPSAKLGIQLIPMDPSMVVLASDKQRIQSNVEASIGGSNFNVPLGDYDLMYLALNDPQHALSLASQQTNIDDGNSKTYFYAWLFAQADRSK